MYVAIMVVLAAMVGYLLQRRRTRLNPVVNFLVLAGLIVPPERIEDAALRRQEPPVGIVAPLGALLCLGTRRSIPWFAP
jgi:hypothetical protein